MVTSYKCDLCGDLNGFETNNVVAHQDEKFADLCNKCKDRVIEWIVEEREDIESGRTTTVEEQQQLSLNTALDLIKSQGYIYYKYNKPAPQVLKQRRRRRTKKEMELAQVEARGYKK